MSSVGAEDKRSILLKTQEGKIRCAERENRPPSGKMPYGYTWIKNKRKWALIEEEKTVLLCAVGLMIGKVYPEMPPPIVALVQAHPEGLPDPKIVEALNACGFSLANYYERNGFGKWLKKNPTGKIRAGFMNNLVRDDRYRGSYAIYLRAPIEVGNPRFRGMDKEKKKKIILTVPRILAARDKKAGF
jgi:hypothetical protein